MRGPGTYGIAGTLVLLLTVSTAGGAEYQLQTLEKAHHLFHAATNATEYAEAAREYEYLVNEEGIRNGHLFYTIGNCWFMADEVGRAILNYRRAQQYLANDADLAHNLQTALETRTDLIPVREPPPLAKTFLGWHINTSTSFRWWLFAASWTVLWAAWAWCAHTGRREAHITRAAAAVICAILFTSILADAWVTHQAQPGVITAPEVLARKGDGERYAPAFLDPLHAGTEFNRIEDRGAWWHIRLADGQTCWIPSRGAACR